MKQAKWLLMAMLLSALPAGGEVTIEAPGGEDDLLNNLRAHLGLQSEPCDAPEWRVERLFRRAEKELDPALRALGYYQAKVTKSLDRSGECWLAAFTIELGKRVTVRSRNVVVRGEALSDKQFQPLLSGLPLAEGDPLDHGRYEEIKRRLSDFALERGYFDFKLTRKELRVDPAEAAADINIEGESGPR